MIKKVDSVTLVLYTNDYCFEIYRHLTLHEFPSSVYVEPKRLDVSPARHSAKEA